ncbi:hypothetical protein TWF696_001676 [Orbilia brochopaga]|uniref:Zn(2)-C6 fungal-type domain-containing protein n=1 Tax=Orbilia brochopaga TaxID=3140254 RepID=A0AAV9U854_9PEZI
MQSDRRRSDAAPPAELDPVDKMPAIQGIALNTPPTTPAQSNHPTKPSISSSRNMLSDKPVACTRCKAKKIKCDGKTPSCSACTKAREQCLIADMVTGKAHPRGYIQQMQTRISELQSLIDTKTREARVMQSRQASTSSYADSPVMSDPLTPAKRSSATSLPRESSEPVPTPHVDDSEADLALARLLVQTLHLKDHGPCISKLSYLISDDSSTSAQLSTLGVELPSEGDSEKLIELYIKTEHRCFPFLLEDEIYEIMGRVHSIGTAVQGPTPQDLFRAFMIFAIGALSDVKEGSDPTAIAFSYYNSALMYAGGLPMMSGIPAIQNMLLLCLFSLNAKITQDAWRLSRRALHICIQEELHLNVQRGDEGTQKSREGVILDRIQRNVFWSAYCLNRITSNMVYDRPPSIPEPDIDVEEPTEADTTLMSMSNGAQVFSRPPSLLPSMVRLYRLSTIAFTSFNSNPPKGDTVSKLEGYVREFLASKNAICQDMYGLPVYMTLSRDSHLMLVFQWAVTSLGASRDGLPEDIQNLALFYCAEALYAMATARAESRQHATARISFIITLRTLFVVLSVLLARPLEQSRSVIPGDTGTDSNRLDGAMVDAIEYLILFGKRFGHRNSYMPALMLALRYGLFEWERKRSDTAHAGAGNIAMDVDSAIPQVEQPAMAALGVPNDEYAHLIPKVMRMYPRMFDLFQSMELNGLPLNLELKPPMSEEEEAAPAGAFAKFGSSAAVLEVLSKQVLWRLRVQLGGSEAGDLVRAFNARLGADRMVAPYPQIGAGSSFNSVTRDEVEVSMEGTASRFEYQPITEYVEGVSGVLTMDVDFSGFETNIVTYL